MGWDREEEECLFLLFCRRTRIMMYIPRRIKLNSVSTWSARPARITSLPMERLVFDCRAIAAIAPPAPWRIMAAISHGINYIHQHYINFTY